MNDFTPAFVLHRAPFQNTSALVSFWSRDYGRIKAVVKQLDASQPKQQMRNAWLQPFQQLNVIFSGRSSLKTVYSFEPATSPLRIPTKRLGAGLYMNQLLLDLPADVLFEAEFFDVYAESLNRLSDTKLSDFELASLLRSFEMQLLVMLGYEISWAVDTDNQAIEPESFYIFKPMAGFQRLTLNRVDAMDSNGFEAIGGDRIQLVATGDWQQPGALSLMRWVHKQQLAAI